MNKLVEKYRPKVRPPGKRRQFNVRVRARTNRDFRLVAKQTNHCLDDCADHALAFVAAQPKEWQNNFFAHLPRKNMGAKLRL